MKKTKGIKIDQRLVVETIGTMLMGNMAWETPYIRFTNGWMWVSDLIELRWDLVWQSFVGKEIHISGWLYGNRLRRVKVLATDIDLA